MARSACTSTSSTSSCSCSASSATAAKAQGTSRPETPAGDRRGFSLDHRKHRTTQKVRLRFCVLLCFLWFEMTEPPLTRRLFSRRLPHDREAVLVEEAQDLFQLVAAAQDVAALADD